MLSLGRCWSCFNPYSKKPDTPYRVYCCYFLPVWWGAIWTTYGQFYHK